MRKLFTFLFASIILTACTDEQFSTENELQVNEEQDQKINALDDYIGQMESHIAAIDKEADFFESKSALVFKQANEKYAKRVLSRKVQKANQDFEKNAKSVIKVPGDYTTLQEAVDNALPNGQILVVGALIGQGDVYIDVPSLRIKGNDKGSISGNAIYFVAESIELSNLDLQIKIVIGEKGSGAKISNNELKSPPVFNFPVGLISMNNASECIIKNNIIRAQGIPVTVGIEAFGCSSNEFKSNTIYGDENTFVHMFFRDSNNNEIKDCNIENGGQKGNDAIALIGSNSDNIIKGCTVKNVNCNGILLDGGPWGNPNGWGKNNHIVDCNVFNHNGVDLSRGIGMGGVAYSSIRNCVVNNKNAVDPDNVHSEGITMGFVSNSKIENCTAEYNSGGGIVLAGNLIGDNSIRNCKANNNGGTLNPNGLGTFGFWISPDKFQQVYGSVTIDNCEANNNKSIATPQRMISALEVWSPAVQNFSFTISNCKANNNTGALGGITALLFIIDFPGSPYVRNPDILWNLKNNQANGNDQRGISLFGTDNALVTNNTAQNNGLCDFGETLNIGTVLTNNNFGIICSDPIPVP